MAKLEINEQFQNALDRMERTKRSLFITGKAGTGKSTLLSHFCHHTDQKPVILAPTGVAALNVKGQTIHSFFNFYVDVTPQKIRDKKSKPRNAKLYRKLKTIIIDEISMVRADLLDCIDVFLRMYGPSAMHPFGGVQMIFIGDLYQLPPVISKNERVIFETHYKTPYFFSSHVLQDFIPEIIELDKVYRQKDPKFVRLLNKIRNNLIDDHDVALLNTRCEFHCKPVEEKCLITLTATNARADEINQMHLDDLHGKVQCANAEIKGDFTKEYFPTTLDLRYKVGAQIMMLNNDNTRRWVNGSIGIIEAIGNDAENKAYVKVRLQNGKGSVDVYPHTWEVYRFGVEGERIVSEVAGTFTQYPFRLAWAITIHKSQGKTFDQVTIDIGRGVFASGQIYVALSRCTSFDGIILKTPISRHHIRTDPRIVSYLACEQFRAAHETFPIADKIRLIENAIREKSLLTIVYLRGNDTTTARVVRPLRLGKETYQGKEFMGMKAFCTILQEDRVFSIDRILDITPSQLSRTIER